MRKIHVTWQFFKAGGPQRHFFEKKQKTVSGSGLEECVNQISGLHRLARSRDTNKYIHKYINIQVKLEIFLTCYAARLTWILITYGKNNFKIDLV